MRITETDGTNAVAQASGVGRRVRVDLLSDVEVGDYVLVHAGLAIAKVDEDEARKMLALHMGMYDEV